MIADVLTPEADQQPVPQLTDEERRLLVEQAIERATRSSRAKSTLPDYSSPAVKSMSPDGDSNR